MDSNRLHSFLLPAALALLLAGCVSPQDKSQQLARIAKDWCLTIRASQVIPVYPLTRDLQPGDVFLTMTPIGEEVALFEQRGFLPLDVHLVRLGTSDRIAQFYATRLGEGADFPGSVSDWEDLPACAFPTYSFDISRSGGLNLAIPVQGVPVGFNYLGAAAATGTISLERAQTVGLDIASLRPLLDAWEKENQGLLSAYASDPADPEAQPVFVRIITRVFRVSAVSVQMNDAARAGAELAAGVALPEPDPGVPSATDTAAEQYQAVADRLSTSLGRQFGGRLQVVNVTRRSILLQEEFPSPMAVGYLAFDCRVLPGGILSAPMPTYQRLTQARIGPPGYFNSAALVQAWYTADEANRVAQIKEWMESNLDPQDEGQPGVVEFLSQPRWDAERRRMMRDFGFNIR